MLSITAVDDRSASQPELVPEVAALRKEAAEPRQSFLAGTGIVHEISARHLPLLLAMISVLNLVVKRLARLSTKQANNPTP
jgi:hypothetical protein